MTHAEMMLRPGGAFFEMMVFLGPAPPSTRRECVGELAIVEQWPDQVQGRDGDGTAAEHQIELYRCAQCRAFIVFDATAGRLLNQYQEQTIEAERERRLQAARRIISDAFEPRAD